MFSKFEDTAAVTTMDYATMEENAPLTKPVTRRPYGAAVAVAAVLALGATSAAYRRAAAAPALVAAASTPVRVHAYADAL